MTKEAQQAKELVEKFRLQLERLNVESPHEAAKQCALICVQNEKDLLTKLYNSIPPDINREAWRKWRVQIEDAGIENEQLKNVIELL